MRYPKLLPTEPQQLPRSANAFPSLRFFFFFAKANAPAMALRPHLLLLLMAIALKVLPFMPQIGLLHL